MMPGAHPHVHRRRAIAGLIAVTVVCLAGGASGTVEPATDATRPLVTIDGDPRAGFVTVKWQCTPATKEGSQQSRLQVAGRADFADARERYRGPHRASVLSGLPEGPYWFRVCCERPGTSGTCGEWSKPVSTKIAYHSRGLAGLLFGLGGLVFGLTAGFLMGARNAERGDD